MQEHERIVRSLDIWKGEVRIEPMPGGMTNHNYLVTDEQGKYVAKFAPESTKLLCLDQEKEYQNAKIADENNIGVKIIGRYPEHHLLISGYLESKMLTIELAQRPEILAKAAALFRRLHALPGFLGELSPMERAQKYLEETVRRGGWVPAGLADHFTKVKSLISSLSPSALTACHLDIMLENILIDNSGKLKLIDWEYSETSDPRYDLAMYILKAKLNAKQEAYFLSRYGMIGEEEKEDVNKMKLLAVLAEVMYGVLQNAISEKEGVDYKSYAESELYTLETLLQDRG